MAMADVLTDGRGEVLIETARFDGDRFDDVVFTPGAGVRRHGQVKHREVPGDLDLSLFSTDAQRLRLDRLIQGSAAHPEDGAELRVVTTLRTDRTIVGAAFVAAPGLPPFAAGIGSTRWRLDADFIWPDGAAPILSVLRAVDRPALLAFCARFAIEADATPMSGSLSDPGALERSLIARVRDDVGVEQYPNRNSAVDVASRLLEIAGALRARKQDRRVDFAAIARAAGLQVDRGRVAQAFPLDRHLYVPQVPLRRELGQATERDRRVVIEGPPGAGKSWALEAFGQDLRENGWIVARHYCFLAPGDPDVGQRIAVETMTANLIAELLDDARLDGLRPGIGGEIASLERVLRNADERLAAAHDGEPVRVALIVDGLDHVARVDPAPGVTPVAPGDLAERLALLELPERVTLIVGSQPGDHLDALLARGAHRIEAPPLQLAHTAALLARQGILRALRRHGLDDDHAATVQAAQVQAAGNPLYVSFLGREVHRALDAGEPVVPSRLIEAVPGPRGDLEGYYRHLLSTVDRSPDNGVLAEHLSLIDFPVIADELDEILPALGRARIDRALAYLRPVLHSAGTQGGVRIHHESLRRFIVARLTDEGRPLRALLDPVIAWLDARGLFADDRAFRFLLPLLRRAHREDDLLARVRADFVASSVIELQPQAAVEANLTLAALVAGARRDFPALVRLAELKTAAEVAFGEKLSEPTAWAASVIDLEGGERLANRLLFDGRPTWPRESGLRLCALVDQAGGSPPWSQYLALPKQSSNAVRNAEQDQRYALDELFGQLRTVSRGRAVERLAEWLGSRTDLADGYIDGIGGLVTEVFGPDTLQQILDAAPDAEPRARAWLELRMVEARSRDGDTDGAAAAGRRAVAAGLPCRAVRRLLGVGLDASELVGCCPDPGSLVGALHKPHSPDEPTVDAFLSCTLVRAAAGEDLAEMRATLGGAGFYLGWLRFCCDLAVAAYRRADVVRALAELAQHDEPFVGDPRASDLYGIHGLCRETFARAAALVKADQWPDALGHLLRIARGTTTYFQRSPNGPLTLWALLEVLQPYAPLLPLDVLRAEPDRAWRSEYYDFHSETTLLLGRIEQRAGAAVEASEALRAASRFLASYGMHKDVTVFGLIEALEPIHEDEHHAEVSRRLRALQLLCDRALAHSDGKETNHAPSAWYRAFALHTPGAAAASLTRTILEDPPYLNSRHDEALGHVLGAAQGRIPPLLHHLLWRCLPAANIERWLATVAALATAEAARAHEAFQELAAAADGDPEHPSERTAEAVRRFAADRGWPDPELDRVPETRHQGGSSSTPGDGAAGRPPRRSNRGPFFDGAATPLEILLRLRDPGLDTYERPLDAHAFAAEFIERLRELSGATPALVVSLVEAFCREQRFARSRSTVVTEIAEAFVEDSALAAELLAIAWTVAESGWDPFGGLEHADLLRRAFALDLDVGLARLAQEFAHAIQQSRYGIGLTRRAAELLHLAGRDASALECWDAAYEVVEYRLPATARERLIFSAAGPDLDNDATVRAFAGILGALVGHPDYERRGASLAGIAELFGTEPEFAASAIEPLLRHDAAFTDTLIAVRLLELADTDGAATSALRDWLPAIASASGFGLQQSGDAMLNRLGEPTPPARARDARAQRTITAIKIDEALTWDSRDRVHRLGGLWQPFPRTVAARYWSLLDADPDAARHIISEQFDTQFSRTASWLPLWAIHRWEAELFEIAVHDSVDVLIGTLVASGRWRPGQHQWLHGFLSADVEAAVARARSPARYDRWACRCRAIARAATTRRSTARTAREAWMRVALWEHELREGDDYYTGESIKVHSGLWCGAGPGRQQLDDDQVVRPFALPKIDFRWHDQQEPDKPTDHLPDRWRPGGLTGFSSPTTSI